MFIYIIWKKCNISNEMFTLTSDFCNFILHVRWQISNKNIKLDAVIGQ